MTDPAKAVVPGATVIATRTETGTEQKTVTNTSGFYLLPELPPGQYELQVRKEGFQTTVRHALDLHVNDRAQLDFELMVGSTTQTVVVTGASELVNTSDASVGTVVDRQFVANMPLNGRSFQSLITLTPGVVVSGASSGSPGQFSINGQRPDANYFTLDGVSANVGVASGGSILSGAAGSGVQPSSGGGYNNLVSVDAMQEFKIQTSTFAPEYGRTPGGQISIVSRSGTNQFHGDVFDYFRNNDLDANDWFLNARGGAHPPERQNDFGGVFGGPILRDKLFFFGSYEGLRLTLPAQTNTYVPSLCARGTGPCPAGVTAAVAPIQPYLNAFPIPTAGGCPGVLAAGSDPKLAPFCKSYPARTTLNATSFRSDYSISNKMTLFARWNYAPSFYTNRIPSSTSLMKPEIDLTSYTAGYAYTITPTLVNDLHFNYTFVTGYATSTVDNFGGAVPVPNAQLFPSALSVPGASPVSASNSRILFIITPATSWRTGLETKNESHQYDYVDSVSWSRGSHQLKFGGDVRRLTPVQARAGYQQNFTFATTASLTAGLADTFVVGTNPYSEFLFYNYSAYAQDSWKVDSRLTLTYGLRWDYNPSPGTLNQVPFLALNRLDLNNLGASVLESFGTPLYHSQKDSFAPRIGVAYQLSQDPRWGRVVRAGWGLFFDTTGDTVSQLSTISGSNSIFAAGGQFPALTQFPPTLAQQTPAPAIFTPPFPAGLIAADPNLRNPYVYQWNVAFEQSLGSKQSLTVTYAGAIGRDLLLLDSFAGAPLNTPSGANLPLGFQAITNGGTSDYHSLQTLFQRRLSAGLQVMASYAWSHSIDRGSNVGASLANPTIESRDLERASSDFDIRHSFQTGINYSLPTPGAGRFATAALGHWGTDMIFRARSGPPINVIDGNAFFSDGLYPNTKITTRPILNPGAPIYLHGAQCAAAYAIAGCPGGWALNPDSKTSIAAGIPPAFLRPPSCPATGICQTPTQGTLGRNALRGYGWNQLDFTLRREFPIHEKIALQFRADFFNLLNHPSFAFPPGSTTLNVANAAFGRPITMLNNALASSGGVPAFNPLYQIGGPRSIQLSLKLVF
ncbi:MAG: TonB-dependent receptor [Bryobacteraceae bacterium]